MTNNQQQKRNEKAQTLKVIQVNADTFFVESSKGQIAYRIQCNGDSCCCSCGDYARNIKADPDFRCKHIIALMDSIPTGEIEPVRYLTKQKPKLKEDFIIQIDGKDFVKYAGLLDLAHQIGLSKSEVETLQLPTKENGDFAICRATVVSKTGETFIDLGDANPQNCNAKVGKHLLRLASTRSIARSLRAMTNIGMTCLEELDGIDDVAGNNKSNPKSKSAPKKVSPVKKAESQKQPEPNESASDEPKTEPASENMPAMSEAQRRAIANLSRRRGISMEDVENMADRLYAKNLEALTVPEASSFIRELQTAA